jgi:Zn/Cd-binding protein ZinT
LIANSGESDDQKDPCLRLGWHGLASAQAFAHGNHSHGPALTEAEVRPAKVFLPIKRTGAERLGGIWQSVNPYLLNGDLDPVLEQKAKKGGKSVGNIANIIRRATPPMWTRLASKIT